METKDTVSDDEPIHQNVIGRVKWFNRKKGFGFICVVNPEHELNNTDLFFHYTSIKTENFKILYPGEYVSFDIFKNEEEKWICNNITGIYGNELLTDNTTYHYRITYKNKQ